VKVDPDEIRRQLPEFMLYASLCAENAGELTNKECGYISEIITLASLESGKNVLVDGSLRDSEWYKLYFKMLRETYSFLKIAILHVVAPREDVFQRATVSSIGKGIALLDSRQLTMISFVFDLFLSQVSWYSDW
jgi:hypothetical protein